MQYVRINLGKIPEKTYVKANQLTKRAQSYLKKVYRANEAIFKEKKLNLTSFKTRVLQNAIKKGTNYSSLKKGVDALFNSKIILGEKGFLVNNLRKALRKSGLTKDFQKKISQSGKFAKIDNDKLMWNSETKTYDYETEDKRILRIHPEELSPESGEVVSGSWIEEIDTEESLKINMVAKANKEIKQINKDVSKIRKDLKANKKLKETDPEAYINNITAMLDKWTEKSSQKAKLLKILKK